MLTLLELDTFYVVVEWFGQLVVELARELVGVRTQTVPARNETGDRIQSMIKYKKSRKLEIFI